MSRRQEDELFRQALSELDELDHEAMWRAKLGGEPVGGAGAGDDRPGTGQAPGRDEGAPPTGEDALFEQELLSTFAELLDGEEALAEPPSADDEPAARYRAVRVGESPVDLSPLPGLARPREAELRNLASGRREVDRRIDLHRRTVADGLRLLRDELAHARETG
ncbi:MAG: hypothetical protein FJ125_10445, partial [Deltaproteobacteria bacterium]|nr:hypothetical protein [Deltaproteobacteria bacterium]